MTSVTPVRNVTEPSTTRYRDVVLQEDPGRVVGLYDVSVVRTRGREIGTKATHFSPPGQLNWTHFVVYKKIYHVYYKPSYAQVLPKLSGLGTRLSYHINYKRSFLIIIVIISLKGSLCLGYPIFIYTLSSTEYTQLSSSKPLPFQGVRRKTFGLRVLSV